MTAGLRTWLAIPAARRKLLIEAFVLVMALRAGLRLLPFTAVRRCAGRMAGLQSSHACRISDVVWAVAAISSRVPGTTCLVEALSVECMLRRRGHEPALRIGVRRRAAMSIDAHAWVECSGTVVIGTTRDLREYAVLSAEQPAQFN
jgi:Transglutaminase-like superfamily